MTMSICYSFYFHLTPTHLPFLYPLQKTPRSLSVGRSDVLKTLDFPLVGGHSFECTSPQSLDPSWSTEPPTSLPTPSSPVPRHGPTGLRSWPESLVYDYLLVRDIVVVRWVPTVEGKDLVLRTTYSSHTPVLSRSLLPRPFRNSWEVCRSVGKGRTSSKEFWNPFTEKTPGPDVHLHRPTSRWEKYWVLWPILTTPDERRRVTHPSTSEVKE